MCGLRGKSRKGGEIQIQPPAGIIERLDLSDVRLGDLRVEGRLWWRERELRDSVSYQRKIQGSSLRRSRGGRMREVKDLGA